MRGPLDVHGVDLDRFTDWMLWGWAAAVLHSGLRPSLAAALLHCGPELQWARRCEPGMPGRHTDQVRRRCEELRLASGWACEIACRLGDMARVNVSADG